MTSEDREMDEDAAIAAQRAADVAAGLPACKVCGCTDNAGCDPPCWWVEPNLCSACASADTAGLLQAAKEEFGTTQRAKIFLGYPSVPEASV